MLVAGVDFGRHRDPTVSCVLDTSRLPWRLVRYVSLSKRSWEFHVQQVSLQLKDVNHTLADATGVGDALYERLPNCYGCVLVGKVSKPKLHTPGRVVLSVGFLMGCLLERLTSRNLVVDCDAPDLKDQLLRFHVKVGKSGRLKYKGEKNYHDDAVFALALATVAAMLPGYPRREQNAL